MLYNFNSFHICLWTNKPISMHYMIKQFSGLDQKHILWVLRKRDIYSHKYPHPLIWSLYLLISLSTSVLKLYIRGLLWAFRNFRNQTYCISRNCSENHNNHTVNAFYVIGGFIIYNGCCFCVQKSCNCLLFGKKKSFS